MIRLYKKDNSGFKDFSNNLFSTNRCTFDFENNTVTVDAEEYYIDKTLNLNECSCNSNSSSNKIRAGVVAIDAGVDNVIRFSEPFTGTNYTLTFTAYNDDGVFGVEIKNRTATGFVVNPLKSGVIEYQAIYNN